MTPDEHLEAVAEMAEESRSMRGQFEFQMELASDAGLSLRAIGEAAGLSHSAVAKILQRRRNAR